MRLWVMNKGEDMRRQEAHWKLYRATEMGFSRPETKVYLEQYFSEYLNPGVDERIILR
jgi:hypothetical protein